MVSEQGVCSESESEIVRVREMSVVAGNFRWHFDGESGDNRDEEDDFSNSPKTTASMKRPVRRKKKSYKVRETQEIITSQLQG